MAEPTVRDFERARVWAAAKYPGSGGWAAEMRAVAGEAHAQALADERARNAARLRKLAGEWKATAERYSDTCAETRAAAQSLLRSANGLESVADALEADHE